MGGGGVCCGYVDKRLIRLYTYRELKQRNTPTRTDTYGQIQIYQQTPPNYNKFHREVLLTDRKEKIQQQKGNLGPPITLILWTYQ